MPARWIATWMLLALAALARGAALPDGAPAPDTWRVFGSADGLPQATVFALAQDSAGLLYAGTQDGLSRFDGRRFSSLEIPASAGLRPQVTHLQRGPGSGLWVGTDDGLWLLADAATAAIQAPGQWRELLDPQGRRITPVEALLAQGDEVLAGTPARLYRCDRGGSCQPQPLGIDLEIAELLPVPDGLWIGTNQAGLYFAPQRTDGSYGPAHLRLAKADGLPTDSVRALRRWGGPDGSDLWVGTGRGLARFRDGRLLARFDPGNGFPPFVVNDLLVLRRPDGTERLYAATFGGGLASIADDGRFELRDLDQGLPDSYLYTLFATPGRRGGQALWAGTAGAGAARQESGRWSTIDQAQGLPHASVVGLGIARFPDGPTAHWVGTLNGPVRHVDGRWQAFLPPRYARRVTYGMADDGGQRTWLATDRGLLEWRAGGDWRAYTLDDSPLPGLAIARVLWEAAPRRLWIATRHGIALLDDAGVQPAATLDPRLSELAVQDWIVQSSPAALLLAGGGTLYRWADDRLVELDLQHCPALRQVLDLHPDSGRRFWAATRRGLQHVTEDAAGTLQCRALLPEPGTPRLQYQVLDGGADSVYLFGYDGARLLRFARDTAGRPERLQWQLFGVADGLPSLEFNRAGLRAPDGRIWAANARGVALYLPELPVPPGPPAPLLLQARLADGTPLAAASVLPAQHAPLRFAARLLDYRAEHRHQYRWQLHGLDPAPGPWQAQADLDYLRLPPGDYRLEVQARSVDGRESGPQQLAFRVARPTWQQPWFIATSAIALVACGLLAGRWRSRALARRAATLEALVQARTQELRSANQQLEAASLSDALTGLGNRRGFDAASPALLADPRRPPARWLLLADLDWFKQVNDQHGHAAGDRVLQEAARRWQALAPERLLAWRWGGEEFLLLAYGQHAGQCLELAEAVRLALERQPVDGVDDGPPPAGADPARAIRQTCSIGAVELPPGALDRPRLEAAIRAADAALYRAKAGGRNRVEVAAPGEMAAKRR